jgi:hypothetical protein
MEELFREVTMSEFKTELDAKLKDDDTVWVLDSLLVYQSDLVGTVIVPVGFETDFASVPRVPIAYTMFGDRAHREAVIHDYLYRIDATPPVERDVADDVFLEAMECRGKGWFVRYAMYWGVRLGGGSSYHKKAVSDKL